MLGGTSDLLHDKSEIMIKDKALKTFSIPVLGVLIPLLSGLIQYPGLSYLAIVISNLLFIATSWCIWQGSVRIVMRVRNSYLVKENVFLKLAMLCCLTAIYAFAVSGTSSFLWQQILSIRDVNDVYYTALISAAVVIFLTLIYEVLFLSKERELDMKIVDQLDKERVNAELNSLKSELDPHFIFNSLTTLSHLISIDAEKAQLFTQKLSQVYKYLLINKDRELISLTEELKFIDDYFYLLQIRYDNKLQIKMEVGDSAEKIMIVPCSLQLLVENAIKHNQFTDKDPLQIQIEKNGEYLHVVNNVITKQFGSDSTKIGLMNLSNRYRLIYNKDIRIERKQDHFLVKLPLIKQNSL
jgi:sensor histidine kinase YesM